jgi:hypothetical protein
MSRSQFDAELEANRRAFQELREQIRRDHAGKYVGMAFGRIVAVDREYDTVVAMVDSMKPAPACSLVFAAEDDPLFDPPESLPSYEFQDQCDAHPGPSASTVDIESTSRSVR